MSRREKIIMSVMAATVLLGGYLYFVPAEPGSRQRVEDRDDASAREFAQNVIKKFKADTTLIRELFAIRSAEKKWEKDPFLKTDVLLSNTQQRNVSEKAPATMDTQLNLIYTGFPQVETQRLAIINGVEYASGESINDQGHYVRRIQPHQVEIGKRKGPDTIILKLTE